MVVKDRKRKTSEPLSMEQLQERNTRERLTAYRDLVARAAAGEQLRDDDLGTASDLLDALGLPPYAWARDVQAKRDDNTAVEQEARLRAAEPDRRARERDAAERVKALEDELKTMRQRLHEAATAEPMRLMGVMRQRNELRANHPHVLCDIGQAVVFRLQAKRKTMTPATTTGSSDAEGWSLS